MWHTAPSGIKHIQTLLPQKFHFGIEYSIKPSIFRHQKKTSSKPWSSLYPEFLPPRYQPPHRDIYISRQHLQPQPFHFHLPNPKPYPLWFWSTITFWSVTLHKRSSRLDLLLASAYLRWDIASISSRSRELYLGRSWITKGHWLHLQFSMMDLLDICVTLTAWEWAFWIFRYVRFIWSKLGKGHASLMAQKSLWPTFSPDNTETFLNHFLLVYIAFSVSSSTLALIGCTVQYRNRQSQHYQVLTLQSSFQLLKTMLRNSEPL